jgi:peptide/nickel transport system substrate-binding protein
MPANDAGAMIAARSGGAVMTIGTLMRATARAALVAGAVTMLASAAAAQKQGGSITVGLELDIPGLDPIKVGVYDTAAEMAAALLFDTLTAIDDSGKAVPKLAESWTHSNDYKTWMYKLRPGVKFHDGTPFNAQAVAFNIMRQKDPNNHCRCAFYIQSTEKVEAVDDLTVVFHLRDPAVDHPAVIAPAAVNNPSTLRRRCRSSATITIAIPSAPGRSC